MDTTTTPADRQEHLEVAECAGQPGDSPAAESPWVQLATLMAEAYRYAPLFA